MSLSVGTLNEKPLHASLKATLAEPGDRFEVPVDGYIVDIVRDEMLIEIQTRNVAAIRRKLTRLADSHPLRLVCPIPLEKWIVRMGEDGSSVLGRRRSPRRGAVEWLFRDLVYIPALLDHANFSIEVVLMREEELRRPTPGLSWRRRGWGTVERRLLEVVERRLFATPADLVTLLPVSLPQPFTTGQLATALRQPLPIAQKMAYCLRVLGLLEVVGTAGHSTLYAQVKCAAAGGQA